LTYNLR